MRKLQISVASVLAIVFAGAAQADSFVNGGFEAGTTAGWTTASGFPSAFSSTLLPSSPIFSPGGRRSQVIDASYVDWPLGVKIGSTIYSGNFSYRVEDTTVGGNASLISQQVNNYTEANIFFSWKAALQPTYSPTGPPTLIIVLRDLTTNTDLITRRYIAGFSGASPPFIHDPSTDFHYTRTWQIEQLAIDPSLMGHNFLLSVIAADGNPYNRAGYAFLDGFGAVAPLPIDPGGAVPEPATWAMMVGGFGLVGGTMRRRKVAVRFALSFFAGKQRRRRALSEQ